MLSFLSPPVKCSAISRRVYSNFNPRHSNSGSTQKIYAKGLSQAKGKPGSGELYVSDSFITAFNDFLTEFAEYVANVRTAGNNAANADAMIGKTNTIKDALTDTSLIANS